MWCRTLSTEETAMVVEFFFGLFDSQEEASVAPPGGRTQQWQRSTSKPQRYIKYNFLSKNHTFMSVVEAHYYGHSSFHDV